MRHWYRWILSLTLLQTNQQTSPKLPKMAPTEKKPAVKFNMIGLGLALFALIAFFVDLNGDPKVTYTAAIAILMAVWWVTEALPVAITSLLPLLLFPMLGVMDGKAVSETYINYVIFLFIGGFLLSLIHI